jgi:hypothetical protein
MRVSDDEWERYVPSADIRFYDRWIIIALPCQSEGQRRSDR